MMSAGSFDSRTVATTLAPFHTQIDQLEPIALDALQAYADLQTRVDRKYIVSPDVAADLLAAGGSRLQVLEIRSRRAFEYESVYFDTPALASYYGAAYSRRRRFKVRTRTYLDSDLCALEVKKTGGRGETIKVRQDHAIAERAALDRGARDFVSQHLQDLDPRDLAASLTTHYSRSTLLGASGARMTFDTGLFFSRPGGGRTQAHPDVLIETKSPASATPADRWLWRQGFRPIRVSKYATGLALLTPGLRANKWARTLRTHFGWTRP